MMIDVVNATGLEKHFTGCTGILIGVVCFPETTSVSITFIGYHLFFVFLSLF